MNLDYEKATAWMIRNDGMEIPVVTHIYADTDEVDELLALAWFLWENDPKSWRIVLEFLDLWAYCALPKRLSSRIFVFEEVIRAVKQYLSARPYRIFPEDFAKTVACCAWTLRKRGKGIREWDLELAREENVKQRGRYMIDTLNQRFLRARYGGEYNTVSGCRDIYFRVSSVGFDWFPIIRGFVEKSIDMIDTVTVKRDGGSAGNQYDKTPVLVFLEMTGNTNFIEKHKDNLDGHIVEILAEGGSVQQLRGLPANYGRISDKIERLKRSELYNECSYEDFMLKN
jgi:hypothetical protein